MMPVVRRARARGRRGLGGHDEARGDARGHRRGLRDGERRERAFARRGRRRAVAASGVGAVRHAHAGHARARCRPTRATTTWWREVRGYSSRARAAPRGRGRRRASASCSIRASASARPSRTTLALLAGLPALAASGYPVRRGLSRKRMIGEITGRPVGGARRRQRCRGPAGGSEWRGDRARARREARRWMRSRSGRRFAEQGNDTRKYFGTDGIRGRVGEPPITPDFVLRLGYAAGKVLSRADVAPPHRDRPAVLIGKDTRISGYMLESALESGLSAAGVDTLLVGPMPTPGRGLPHARAAAVGRHHGLGLAQPVRGQRHQVLLRRGREAPRRGRARDRGGARPAARHARIRAARQGRARARRRGPLHRVLQGHLRQAPDAARAQARGRLRPRRLLPPRARASSRSSAPKWSRSARIPTASTSTTAAAPRTRRRSPRRSWSTAPISASPSTATATGSPWPTTTARLFDGDQLLYAIAKHRHEAGRAARRRGRHAHDQLRARAAPRRAGHPVRAREGGRPLRARAAARAGLGVRRRELRPHPLPRLPFDGRRASSPRCRCWRRWSPPGRRSATSRAS